MPEGGEVGEEEKENLLKAFEEIQYLIEDLDHANSRSPVCAASNYCEWYPLNLCWQALLNSKSMKAIYMV